MVMSYMTKFQKNKEERASTNG